MKKSRGEVIAAALLFSAAACGAFGKPVFFPSDTD
jgi:predicted small lipoprotein YifL